MIILRRSYVGDIMKNQVQRAVADCTKFWLNLLICGMDTLSSWGYGSVSFQIFRIWQVQWTVGKEQREWITFWRCCL